MNYTSDTICALSTPNGVGAIAMIRLSGSDSFAIMQKLFRKDLSTKESHTAHFGLIKDGDKLIDEVVAVIYKNPKSFTGEDMVEISCHASPYIIQEILRLLLQNGARMAREGEFSLRAYLNGKVDLSQAEAIADLIASENKASHDMAMNQMRGGFAKVINGLREQLIHFASMIELELDFGEEDVEFANRGELVELVAKILAEVRRLSSSFALGNVLKNGVPVAIVGEPNVGKSTLLNLFLNEDRAIVSNIAGTTRDVIEDSVTYDGVEFRFIDTAGIRETADEIESIGIEKAFEKVQQASIILYMVDASHPDLENANSELQKVRDVMSDDKELIVVINKVDKVSAIDLEKFKTTLAHDQVVQLSAKQAEGLDTLKEILVNYVQSQGNVTGQVIVSNARHFNALKEAEESLDRVNYSLSNDIPTDLVAMDIRQCLHHLGEITGNINTEDLLDSIFSNFCIGK
ncbi:tRNA uridine-5-carboxymethylaminomethyl(34) synthesis GTPase MnmE [bacterium SCSIO 12643]|nr:tRNA uridine-5-carboxymethylaminomethyl(34) synthesis GTPase MnmE [bacterium SCSIO 12643]